MIAHGSSKSDRPRLDTERFAAALRHRLGGASVRTAYLEEPPFASGAVDSLSGGSVVVSFFAGEGAHATGDLPAMLARAGMAAVPVIGPLGAEPGIAGIVAAAARASPEIVGLAGGPSSASARPASAM